MLKFVDVYKRQVRSRAAGDEGTKSLDAFIADIQKEIETKVNRVKEVSEEK